MTTTKQIINYKPGQVIVSSFGGNRVAIIQPLGSGTKEIITSSILNYDPVSGVLETEKNIYIPIEKEVK